MRLGPSAIAARISARLLADFEPGTLTVPCTGPSAAGAAHSSFSVLTFATLGYFIKYLDQSNINNAFVSGM